MATDATIQNGWYAIGSFGMGKRGGGPVRGDELIWVWFCGGTKVVYANGPDSGQQRPCTHATRAEAQACPNRP